MIYREHEQVVAFGRWPFVGPIDWLTVASALVGGGVLLGAPLSVLLGLPMYVTFIGCTLLAGALVSQWGTGIAAGMRVLLLLRWLLVRRRALNLDDAAAPTEAPRIQILSRNDEVIIKRGGR